MTQVLIALVSQFGYLAIFLGVGIESLGIPVPGETSLVIGAVVAAQGHLSPGGVALAGLAGAVLGDNTGYWIGRRWGQRVFAAPGIRRVYSPSRFARAERFFERRGWVAVFLGRFVALLRIFAGPLAGTHRMPWPRFVMANAAGAVVWVGAVTAVGLLVGSNLGRAISIVSRAGYAGLAVAAVLALALVVGRLRRNRRERREGARVVSERVPSQRR